MQNHYNIRVVPKGPSLRGVSSLSLKVFEQRLNNGVEVEAGGLWVESSLQKFLFSPLRC